MEEAKRHLRVQPICAILGARQVGKTTLARQFAENYPQNEAELDLFVFKNGKKSLHVALTHYKK